MVKTSTIIVLVLAVAAGAAFYYFDLRKGDVDKPTPDESKPAFAIKAPSEIKSISLSHPDKPSEHLQLEKRDQSWWVVAPIQTGADQTVVEGIAGGIAAARVTQTMPGTADRLKVYGLDTPSMQVDFQLQDGSKHSIKMGGKDFSGVSVYAILDGSKDVTLIPQSLYTTTSPLTFEGVRDHLAMHFVAVDATTVQLKNPFGEISLARDKNDWKFTNPTDLRADGGDVTGLLSTMANARIGGIVSETPDNLAKYGLASPATTFSVTDEKGKSATLLVGKKEGDAYFAHDPSRPMIFKIEDKIYKRLDVKYAELRDKKLARIDEADINSVDLKTPNGEVVFSRKPDKTQTWVIDSPADVKGKPASEWKVLGVLSGARAEEVLDHAPTDVASKLAQPETEITLTAKDGKKFNVELSKESGGFVYARTSDGPAVFKIKKEVFAGLPAKPADIAY